MGTEQDFLGDRELPRAESVTLVLALNPIVGDEKAATIAKTALATGGTIADVAQALGIPSRAERASLRMPERLTRPACLES